MFRSFLRLTGYHIPIPIRPYATDIMFLDMWLHKHTKRVDPTYGDCFVFCFLSNCVVFPRKFMRIKFFVSVDLRQYFAYIIDYSRVYCTALEFLASIITIKLASTDAARNFLCPCQARFRHRFVLDMCWARFCLCRVFLGFENGPDTE